MNRPWYENANRKLNSATRALPMCMRPVGDGAKRTIGEVMRKLRQEFRQGFQQGLQQQLSQAPRREKILAPPPFCQEIAPLSGGISDWPRPGLARRKGGADLRDRRRDGALRYDS
jgi:hypothetical protein